jgi:hypothetical protein
MSGLQTGLKTFSCLTKNQVRSAFYNFLYFSFYNNLSN